jgi:hypothetical protein
MPGGSDYGRWHFLAEPELDLNTTDGSTTTGGGLDGTPSAVPLSSDVHSVRWVIPSPFVRTDIEGDGRM